MRRECGGALTATLRRRLAHLSLLALGACIALCPGPAARAEGPATIEHVVEPGQTLSSISGLGTVYADPYLWPVIYKFNRDQIEDPTRIYPGQRLRIPIVVDAETRRLARVEAGAPQSPQSPEPVGAGP